MSKEDWEESLKPKTNRPINEPIIPEDETTDIVVNSDNDIISDIVDSLDLGVKKVINKIGTKLKKTTK